MNKIKFSREYCKLRYIDTKQPVVLLAILPIHKKDMCQAFIDYDTTDVNLSNYPLPNGDCLLLLFGQNYKTFTTIRKKGAMYGYDKEKYYQDRLGQDFQIVLNL